MVSEKYRMLLTYDIHPGHYERYYQYMLGEFVPTLQKLELRMIFAWHVQGENYPQRQVEFVCVDRQQLFSALNDPVFQEAEARLRNFTMSYSRKIVRFENRFQF
jgi:hypothetical protein